ncbi:MAG: DUF998 domain-containing protein [Methanotrichaceae archaeon]|nr:DUF998 domain-containing protein [Methanotrichaceae archaeon]
MLEFRILVFPAFLALAGISVMGVGLFPEYTFYVHYLAAIITFISGGLSAIAAYHIEKPPLRYMSVLRGIVTLTALALLYFHQDLGLGAGGIERMIVFPFIVWALSFSGYLMQS